MAFNTARAASARFETVGRSRQNEAFGPRPERNEGSQRVERLRAPHFHPQTSPGWLSKAVVRPGVNYHREGHRNSELGGTGSRSRKVQVV
jgi:hypothetical protein